MSSSITETAAVTEPSIITSMAPLVLIFAVFYLLIIRPQQKKMQDHQKMVAALKVGDRVVTNSGIIGVVVTADEGSSEVSIEIAKDVNVMVRRDMIGEVIAAPQDGATISKPMAKTSSKVKTKSVKKVK